MTIPRAARCPVCAKVIRKGQDVEILQFAKAGGLVAREDGWSYSYDPWMGIVSHLACSMRASVRRAREAPAHPSSAAGAGNPSAAGR